VVLAAHDEALADLLAHHVSSYRQLPLVVYRGAEVQVRPGPDKPARTCEYDGRRLKLRRIR
jgi:hypothetical protein